MTAAMAAFVPTGALATTAPRRGRAAARPLAALDIPELDAPRAAPRHAARDAARAEAEALSRDAALRAARAEGFAAGEAAGRAAAAAARETVEAEALAAAATALAAIAGTADAAIGRGAEALARLLLAALDAALPTAAARLAPETAAQLVALIRPVLERSGAVSLAVAPGMAGRVAQRLDDPRLTVTEDAALAPGDARAVWSEGEALMRLADRRAALASMLASLGLADTTGTGADA